MPRTDFHARGVYQATYESPGGYTRLIAVDSEGRVVAHADLMPGSYRAIVAKRLRDLLNALDGRERTPSLHLVDVGGDTEPASHARGEDDATE